MHVHHNLGRACMAAGLLLALTGGSAFAQEIVEGGSPLYQTAVHEALEGLRGRDKPKPINATPKPCPKCGKIHASGHAQGSKRVAPGRKDTPKGELYYCERCKTHHRRKPPVRQ